MFERLSAEAIYNTRAVVQRTGVPADTFRAWERRYAIPVPTRTAGNQRLYSERDIATITWLRDQTVAGMTISQAVALFRSHANARSQPDSPSLASESYPLPRRSNSGGPPSPYRSYRERSDSKPFLELRDELVNALLALDGISADRIVEEALALTDVESVCLYVLQASLTEIGDRWEHGGASVAVEHHASSYVARKFGALFNQSNPNEGRGPIVAACPEGEQHDIGLLLTCLFLSRRGYRILYLGANLPVEDLVDTVKAVQAPLVLLSATREETARRIHQVIPMLKRAVNDISARDLPEIGFGGTIFLHHPELRTGIDGAYLGIDAREAVHSVDQLFATIGA